MDILEKYSYIQNSHVTVPIAIPLRHGFIDYYEILYIYRRSVRESVVLYFSHPSVIRVVDPKRFFYYCNDFFSINLATWLATHRYHRWWMVRYIFSSGESSAYLVSRYSYITKQSVK